VLRFGASLLLVVLAAMGAGWLYVDAQLERDENQLAATLAQVVSKSIHRVSFSGKWHAQLLIEEYIEEQPDLVYLRIEEKDGSVFAAAGELPEVFGPAPVATAGSPAFRDLVVGGQPVREVVTVFRGGFEDRVIGVIRVGISHQRAANRFRTGVIALIVFGLLATVAGMVVVVRVSRAVSRPVQSLATEFAGILAHTPLPLCIQDRDGVIVRVSSRFQEDFGGGRPVEGRKLADLVSREERDALLAEDEELRAGRAVPRRERTLRAGGEDRRYLTGRFALTEQSDGPVVYLVSVALDITEQRALEETLLQARRMESIGQFAGGVAHDFNNILTGIAGVTDLIAMIDGAPDELRGHCDEMRSLTGMAAELTARLLSFGRKQVTVVAPQDLNVVVQDLRGFLGRILRADVPIEMVLGPPEVLPAEVDRGQIDQVLMNLVSNARDAMPDGGRIRVTTGREELSEPTIVGKELLAPGSYGVITISDEGTGIPAEIADRLFDPFATTKKLGKGTGLGLSIVYSIVTRHGGSITFTTEAAEGTTFSVYLPLCDPGKLAGPASAAATPVGPEEALKILVVEDNAFVRNSVVNALMRLGHEVWQAADGEQGVSRFAEDPARYDLVLVDVVLPHMNGAEVCAEITRLAPDTHVLFMTGYDEGILDDIGHDSDRLGWIQKPFTIAQLTKRIRTLLA